MNAIPATTPTGTASTNCRANNSTCRLSKVRVVQLARAPIEQLAQKPEYCRHNGWGLASANVIRRFQKKFQVIAVPIPRT
ncbi:MAG: hypothetical protein VB859_04240 [Planctomycetaceae bacterium]